MERDVRVVSYLGGDYYAVQYLFFPPLGGSMWKDYKQYEGEHQAIAAAKELAASPGHSTACRVVWQSWSDDD